MMTLLLLLIYAAFISLGLPDSMLGAAWPLMRSDIHASADAAGRLFMLTSCCTIISSVSSGRLIRRFGTLLVVAVSTGLTALSMLLTAGMNTWLGVLLCCVPLGLGAGAIDAGLNEFVAEHYSARQMSWLHCFWGVGVTVSPMILGALFARGISWRGGYRLICLIQLGLMLVLSCSLPLWRKAERRDSAERDDGAQGGQIPYSVLIKLPRAWQTMLSFFVYCTIEQTIGLWGATYLTAARGFSADRAAFMVAVYFAAITAGRFVNGVLIDRISVKTMVRCGIALLILGVLCLLAPIPEWGIPVGFFLCGFGEAPFYPMQVKETPQRFGKPYAQEMMGLQTGSGFAGNTFGPPLIGWIAATLNMALIPWALLALALILSILRRHIDSSTAL